MKKIIWASILLIMAAIVMPVLFVEEGMGSEYLADEPSPTPTPSEAPAALPSPSPIPEKTLDSRRSFTVLDGEEVKTLTMEEYLPLVLAAEVPASFAEEALKAQAVAARTYIVYCAAHTNPKHPEANVCTKSGCCMAYHDASKLRGLWGEDYEAKRALFEAAAKDTDGEILRYEALPILASFHSSSAGKTEDGRELWGEVPYLKSVNSPETESDVPNFVTTVEVSTENFRETVLLLRPQAVFPENPADWVTETEHDESGRVRKMSIAGQSLTGSELRKLFSLRSTSFNLSFENGSFLFTVTGYGHGLGLSQYGANVMAKNGFQYPEILAHYYPGAVLGG